MNSRQAIIKDAEVRAILDNLLAGPKRILGQQDALEAAQFEADTYNEVNLAREAVANIEAETAFIIRSEKDLATHKPLYTNEEQRQSATRLVLMKDKEYIAAVQALTNAQRKVAEYKMHVGKLVNQVKYATNEYYANKTALEVVAGLAVEDIDGAAFAKLAQIKALVKTIEEK